MLVSVAVPAGDGLRMTLDLVRASTEATVRLECNRPRVLRWARLQCVACGLGYWGWWRAGASAGLLVASGWSCGATSTGDDAAADSTAGNAGSQLSTGTGGASEASPTAAPSGSGPTAGANGSDPTSGASGSGPTAGVSEPATAGGSSAGGADCSFQGALYADGSSFPAGDGCNTCGCRDGLIQCGPVNPDFPKEVLAYLHDDHFNVNVFPDHVKLVDNLTYDFEVLRRGGDYE